MKDFIYWLVDFMWFWTPDNTRNVPPGGTPDMHFAEALVCIYIIATALPILTGTIARIFANYKYRLPTIEVNGEVYTFEGKLLKQLITGYIIENILFWLVFNTVLLAIPFAASAFLYTIVLGLKLAIFGDQDVPYAKTTLTLKYLLTKLKIKAQKGALNEIKKVQDDYLTIEKQFLDELTSYKNESGSNLLSTGVN